MRVPILLALVMGACAACVPFDAYDSPGMSGSVLGRISGAPIASAQVTVISREKPNLSSTAVTDAGGHFRVEEIKHRIWLPPLPYDSFYPDATVTVSAAGYKSLQTSYYKLHQATDYNPTVTIYLEPQ